MAKGKEIKRIVTKSGEVRYYQSGKRLKRNIGQRRFIKQNPNVNPDDLSPNELKSFKASKKAKTLYKFKNLARVQPVYITILKELGVLGKDETLPNNDLYYLYDENGNRYFENYSDLVEYVDNAAKENPLVYQWCNEVGLPNYRGRTINDFYNNRLTSIVDIVDLIDSPSYKYFKFIVYDTNGEKHEGRVKPLLVLKDFEIMFGSRVRSKVSNSAYLRFCYDYHVDIINKTLTIDLTNMKPRYKDKDGKSKPKTLDYYIENSGGTDAKQKLFITDKYKDVEIEIDFS